MGESLPGYVSLLNTGELERRVADCFHHLCICDVCALNCPVDRTSGKLGACRTGINARVSSYNAHHGEESPLSGWCGSGTIFFTRCNLKCQYCQNHDISQTNLGEEVNSDELARIMLRLQYLGCHNINLVSPSHIVPQILSAVFKAAQTGLHIPLVYNSGGYDSLSMLALLDGVIDIYMPDMKYGDAAMALKYSRIPDYPRINQIAVTEMYRQVGDLLIESNGIATHGLLIRHLVLPNNLAGTERIVQFLAKDISKNTYVNLMDQYYPAYKASEFPELNRRITRDEYYHAYTLALKAGLHRFDRIPSRN
jgi:putative pyruvate formate lyase activating enzyme